jgi:hypothetical protein
MVKSLVFSVPLNFPERGKELEIEVIIAHFYKIIPLQKYLNY